MTNILMAYANFTFNNKQNHPYSTTKTEILTVNVLTFGDFNHLKRRLFKNKIKLRLEPRRFILGLVLNVTPSFLA